MKMPLRVLSICAALSLGGGGALSAELKTSAEAKKTGIILRPGIAYGRATGELQRIDRALMADPHNAQLHMDKGYFLESEGKIDEALKEYELAGEYSGEEYLTTMQCGYACAMSRRHKEACNFYTAALSCQAESEDFARTYQARGLSEFGSRQYSNAILDLKLANELRPDLRELSASTLRAAYWQTGDFVSATRETAFIYLNRVKKSKYANHITAQQYAKLRRNYWQRKDFVGYLNLYLQEWICW